MSELNKVLEETMVGIKTENDLLKHELSCLSDENELTENRNAELLKELHEYRLKTDRLEREISQLNASVWRLVVILLVLSPISIVLIRIAYWCFTS